MRGLYVGCILYADDIMLLSGSLTKLQDMLNLCFNFGYENDLMFNANKSVLISIGKMYNSVCDVNLNIGNGTIKWMSTCNYLGVKICSGKTFHTDCEERRRKFCIAANCIILNSKLLTQECYMHILKTQCLPILLYGARIWSCSNEMLRKIGVSFNNAVRKVFNYMYFESVKDILRGFCILPMDLCILSARLIL